MEKTHQLILKNDEEHDFLFIIACLVRYCGHSADQAEQCSIITHNNGKCDIKSGSFLDMMEIQNELIDLGLTVDMVEYESSLSQ